MSTHRQWFYEGQWHDHPKRGNYEFNFIPLTLPLIPPGFDMKPALDIQRIAFLIDCLIESPYAEVRVYAEYELKKLIASK
jgi:hypothetical protein